MARQKKAKRQPTLHAPPVTTDNAVETVTASPSLRQQRRDKAMAATASKKRERAMLIGVLAITTLAFLNSLNGEFVYDDQFQILKNPSLNSLANIPLMFVQSVWQFMNAASPDAVGLYYRPLFNTVLIINHQLFGANVFGWHLVSLLLHLAATFFIYKIVTQWKLPVPLALTAALLFGVHPVHSESVAWISGLPDPLAAVFLLLSLFAYEKYYRGKFWQDRQTYILVLSLVAALFAYFSKEVAIVFPAFLALREYWKPAHEGSVFERLRVAAQRTAPYFALVVINLALRYAVLGFLSKAEPKAAAITTSEVILTLPSVLLLYARFLFVPYPLAIVYDHNYVNQASSPLFWFSALLVIALLVAAFWWTRASQVGRWSLIWLLLFLLPVLNLKAFNPQESILHDRYLYIPSIGFCILLALALYHLSQFFKAQQERVFQGVTASLCLLFLALTFSQNRTWKNDLTMTTHALQYAPNRPFLHNYLGAYYFNKTNYTQAESAYLKAIDLNPAFYDAYANLGDLYRTQGKLAEAEQSYLKALELGAPYSDTFYNLAVVYTSQNRFPEAEQQLQAAVEKNPTSAAALYNLAWVYDQQGKSAIAEQTYAQTLAIKPDYPEPRINLAILQAKRNAVNEALNNLLTAQTYAPDHPVMLYALGDVYLRMSKYQDAINALTKLIQREPRHRLAYTMLGIGFEGLGNKEQARANFQKAIEVAPQEPYTNTAREHLAKL
ncbi:MAG: tetratricopeptide repeat protein [Acidobacteria bacterium]|nr:tetratricopeptide repeat protein [Acidobacteriota bacterium]